LDVALIVITSIATGTIYQHFFLDGNIDVLRLLTTGAVVAAVFVPVFRKRGHYEPNALMDWPLQIRSIVTLWTVTFLLFTAAAFALKLGHDFSRVAVLSFGFVGMCALVGHHALCRAIIKGAVENGTLRGRKSILLSLSSADHRHGSELSCCGFKIERLFHLNADNPLSEVLEKVIATARGSDVQEIFLAADAASWGKIDAIAQQLAVLPIPLTLIPDDRTARLFQRPPRRFGNTIAVEFVRAPLSMAERFMKRMLDLVCSVAAIVVLMPMFAIIAITIKLDSSGPVFFVQTRHGFNSKRFRIFKFRTMTVQEDGETVRQAVRNDSRITRVGMWLRKTSLDELPQLFNVLMGDMSIVGPRPHATAHDTYYGDLIGSYAFRHHMKPGITGWAQVSGSRGETPTVQSMKERVDLDIWYVDNWSILLDLQVILRTVVEVIRGRNAY
jgi:putative colanic acid biosynthesis UDP-glucose lipid carrier transferase